MSWPDYTLGDLSPDVQAFWNGAADTRLEGLRPYPVTQQAAMDRLYAEMMAGVRMGTVAEDVEEFLPEEMGLCTCGIGNEFQVGHSDWCDYEPPEITAPSSSHLWAGSFNRARGKHGSWTCARCGYEAFKLNAHDPLTAPIPDCPGKPP